MTLIFFLLAPGTSLANPRQKLAGKGYAFTRNGFVKSAENGDLTAVQLFIGAGMAVDTVNNNRVTALFKADEAGQVKVVAYLLGLGAKSKDGEFLAVTYLIALESGNTRLEKLLYTHGMNRDYALTLVAESNLTKAAMRLIGEGANPFSKRGRRALVFAAEQGNLELIRFMLEQAGANDRSGVLNPPLVMAASLGNAELALYLLKKGADANDPEAGAALNGPPALGEAAAAGNARMVELLLKHGADPNMRWKVEDYSETPLIAAAREGHVNVVRLLLDKGARAGVRVNTADGKQSALSLAETIGHRKVVALLRKSGGAQSPPTQPLPRQPPPRKSRTGQQVAQQILNGRIDALKNLFNRQDFQKLSFDQLRVVRNTIFAQYGYPFKSFDLQQHFATFSWYRRGERSFALGRLNETDRINIAMIKALENER
ncbi:MAG: ankyrin repeat domain-containing protein [bacterium]